MSFDVSMKIDAKSLTLAVKQMRALPEEISKQIERKVLKASLEPVLQDALRRVPVGETGNLSNSLGLFVKKVGATYYGEVRARAPHALLVEYGHRLLRGPRKGTQRFIKWVAGTPFLRPAFLAHGEKIIPTAEREIKAILSEFEAAGYK